MVWIKRINNQIKRVDPDGVYSWGIDYSEEKGQRIVCLHRVDVTRTQEFLLRIEDDYSDYSMAGIREVLSKMKGEMDTLVRQVERWKEE